MSLATSKKIQTWQKTTLSSRIDGKQMIARVRERVREDLLGALTFFSIVTTGVGYLFGRNFSPYWQALTLILLGLYVVREWPRQKDIKPIKDVRNTQ